MPEPRLSVCYMVKNEERFLEDSLRSVKSIASEIILVDTGSSDATLKIASAHATRVETFKWCDDFSAPRNFAASFATGDWILFVDGDEILEAAGLEKIREVMSRNDDIVAYGVLQRNYSDDRSFPGWHPRTDTKSGEVTALSLPLAGFADNLMMKFYRNHLGIKWEGVVHETIVGSCRRLGLKHLEVPICILHHLAELKTADFRNEKKLYYLKLAVQKLKFDSDHENPWFEVGICLNNLGRHGEAEKAFAEALVRRPGWDEARLFRARLLLQLERYAEGEVLLRELLDRPEFSQEALGHLATALLYQRKFSECEATIQRAMALGATSLSLHIIAGTLYFEQGEYLKSREHLREAIKLNPADEFLQQAMVKCEAALHA